MDGTLVILGLLVASLVCTATIFGAIIGTWIATECECHLERKKWEQMEKGKSKY